MAKRKSDLIDTNTENPFSGYGRAISGNGFIGRLKGLRTIENRVTKQREPNNLALIGYPRIGKSSMTEQGIMLQQSALLKQRKIPILIPFGAIATASEFFRLLVIKGFESISEHFDVDPHLILPFEKVKDETLSWTSLKSEVERFFVMANRTGFKFIFILDEFDSARTLFHNNYAAFQQLRELGYRASFKVTFVTTSRRSIKEIEIQCAANSVLDLIFKKEYVSMFSTAEINEYFKLYEEIGIELNDHSKSRIMHYCGGHPYLLAVLGFEIVESYRDATASTEIDDIFSRIRLDFEDYYEQLVSLLKEDGTYEKLIQILFGPMLNVTDSDIKELTEIYGLLHKVTLPDNDQGLAAFSQHFQEYLSSLGRSLDFWDLWISLEVRMRELIAFVLKRKYDEGWTEEIRRRHPEIVKKAETIRAKSREDYAQANLLAYFDAQPLFEIIFSNRGWIDFKEIFGGESSKEEFTKKFKLIISIRNPYAHSRFASINKSKVQQAEIYCAELLDQLNNYQQESF